MTPSVEKALIGALLYPGSYTLIVDFFKKNYIQDEMARAVYGTIEELIRENIPVENSLIASRLANGNREREAALVVFLVECQFACPSSLNIKHYANQIIENYLRKRIKKITQDTAMQLANPDTTTRDIQGFLTKEVHDILEGETHSQAINVTEAISKYVDQYHAMLDKEQEGTTRMFYGIDPLDEITSGITPGEFIVIAARTNIGKSILALNMHYNMGKQKKKILYCSIEMSETQITSRLLSRITGIPQIRFQKYQLTEAEHDKVAAAYEEILTYDIHFLTKGELTLENLQLELIKNQEHQYDAVIVDYVQIMTHGDNRQGMTEKVTQLSHGLKQLAQEYNTAIIGVAQLNRDAVKDGKPELHHLQNSGALEQDAEVVILIHRDPEDPECVNGKRLYLLVRKNRKGQNNVDIMLDSDLSRMFIANKSAF